MCHFHYNDYGGLPLHCCQVLLISYHLTLRVFFLMLDTSGLWTGATLERTVTLRFVSCAAMSWSPIVNKFFLLLWFVVDRIILFEHVNITEITKENKPFHENLYVCKKTNIVTFSVYHFYSEFKSLYLKLFQTPVMMSCVTGPSLQDTGLELKLSFIADNCRSKQRRTGKGGKRIETQHRGRSQPGETRILTTQSTESSTQEPSHLSAFNICWWIRN